MAASVAMAAEVEQRFGMLKRMLDSGVISQTEHDDKPFYITPAATAVTSATPPVCKILISCVRACLRASTLVLVLIACSWTWNLVLGEGRE